MSGPDCKLCRAYVRAQNADLCALCEAQVADLADHSRKAVLDILHRGQKKPVDDDLFDAVADLLRRAGYRVEDHRDVDPFPGMDENGRCRGCVDCKPPIVVDDSDPATMPIERIASALERIATTLDETRNGDGQLRVSAMTWKPVDD